MIKMNSFPDEKATGGNGHLARHSLLAIIAIGSTGRGSRPFVTDISEGRSQLSKG